MEDIADIICHLSTVILINVTMRISDIYVRINGYLLQEINIHWHGIKIQRSMLDNPDYIQQQIYQNFRHLYLY